MYYVVKSIKDAKRIHRKHPYLNIKTLERVTTAALSSLGFTSPPAIYVPSTGGYVEYCELSYYKNNAKYGEQVFFQHTIKYNKGTK